MRLSIVWHDNRTMEGKKFRIDESTDCKLRA